MTIRIVTDSASDISLEEAEDLGIEIVPLSVRFGDAEYTDLVDLSVSDFYQQKAETDHLPSTADGVVKEICEPDRLSLSKFSK